ncbi:MAG: hypothetical protein Q8K30_00545 [Candidatus Gracilibacteria bacterium]|nr:hypothetical protein [Candidatus Gracilibacteria bacterium]
MYIYEIIIIIILLIIIYLFFKFKKSYKLTKNKKAFYIKQLKFIIGLDSYKEQVIDMDKLYHKILLEVGYKGTFGEILKQKPIEISDLNQVWELHKFRNRLVHEFDSSPLNILKENATYYVIEIKKLLNKF